MRRTLRYALACAGVIGVAMLSTIPLLDAGGTRGLVAAAGVALPVQVGAFAALVRADVGTNAFLGAWLGGTVVRMLVVGVGGWALIAVLDQPPVSTLLGLAGFFFAMLLMEPHFLGIDGAGATKGPKA